MTKDQRPIMSTLIDLFKLFKNRRGEVFVYRTGIRRLIFTYPEIYDLSLRMASFLERKGIRKGDRVALWAANSPWWAVAYFGIILKGAIVVPIDFVSGAKRGERIIELSGAKFLVQSNYKLEKIIPPTGGLKSVMIEDLQFVLQRQSLLPVVTKTKASDMAELVYTSGTTGDPKGVILTHKNIMTNILQAVNHIAVKEKLTFLSVLPLSHMFEQTIGFLTPLHRGDKIVYLRTIKPSAITSTLTEENISVLPSVPRLLDLLKNTIDRELAAKKLTNIFKIISWVAEGKSREFKKIIFSPVHKKFGKNFKFFISAGSALSIETAKFWKKLGFTVIEGYGLTETSPLLTANTLAKQVLGSVGVPVEGVRLKIKEGEILAKGSNVFSGYFENSEATEKAFDDKGWFKTGDTGTIDKDGNVYVRGRIKDVIITSEGINVYPSDIESVLNYTNGVKESCVVGFDKGRGEEVHAVLILKPGVKDAGKIIRETNNKLDPQNQITSFSVWKHADFPKTTILKIQKFKVLEVLSNESEKQESSAQDSLISIIASLSGKPVDEVKEKSILTADLGFTSISRLELVNYLEQEFRLDLDDTSINQLTRVTDLRKIISKGSTSKNKDRLMFWPNTAYGIKIRENLDRIIHFPFLRSFMILNIKGLGNLKEIKGPVIFVSNHLSHLDQPAIMRAMPKKLRYSTATAMKEEFFFREKLNVFKKFWKELNFTYATFGFNSFLLPQKKGFRKNLYFMGKLIDNNINILMFPEGTRGQGTKLQNFMPGIGLMVKELGVPVVPIKIVGIEKIFPRGAKFPKKGDCMVIFGKPIDFTTETPEEIVEMSRRAILDLTTE